MLALSSFAEEEIDLVNGCPSRIELGSTSHWIGDCDDWVGARHQKRSSSGGFPIAVLFVVLGYRWRRRRAQSS